jgi:hypothetical protein
MAPDPPNPLFLPFSVSLSTYENQPEKTYIEQRGKTANIKSKKKQKLRLHESAHALFALLDSNLLSTKSSTGYCTGD